MARSDWALPLSMSIPSCDSTQKGWIFAICTCKLNEVTRKDSYPLPRIDDLLDSLHVWCPVVFNTWPMDWLLAGWSWPQGSYNDSILCPQGLFQFRVMPFGLCIVPSTFQRLMKFVLTGISWRVCLVYLIMQERIRTGDWHVTPHSQGEPY